MKDIEISVVRETRIVNLNKKTIGNDGENLQGNLIFRFEDTFVNGQARLEYSIDDTKEYVMLTKIKDYYTIPIKSVMTKYGKIFMQLVITEGTNSNEIPIFKSNVFYLFCDNSINAEIEQPSEYPLWIDIANTKLNSVDEALEKSKSATEHAQKQGDYAKVQGDYAKYTATDTKNKADEGYFDGKSLEFIWRGTELGIRVVGDTEYQFVNLQGVQGIKGDTGEPFKIKKTYPSVQAMKDDFSNMEFGDYVMIASSVEEEDNAKLYTRGEYEWIYITDFSGAMGIRGPVGKTPQLSIGNVATIEPNESANVTISGTDESPVLNFSLPRGKTGDKGDKGEKGDTGATGNGIQDITKVSSEGLVDTYQINYTDGTNTSFDVTNGEDGNVLQQEEIDKLNANIDQLESILPKKTATGTNTLEYKNAKAYKLFEGEYEGREYQETTAGKNMYETTTPSNTINGVKFIVNEDGTIKVNGTATAKTQFTLNYKRKKLKKGKYKVVGCPSGGTNKYRLNLSYYTLDNVYIDAVNDWGDGSVLNYETDDILGTLSIIIENGVTINNLVFKPMVSTDLEATYDDYEPFTNGPSPNPDNPQEVETLKGYNEFDGEIELGSINLDDGSLVSSTTKTRSKNFIKVKPNTTYYFSREVGNYKRIIGYTKDKTGISDGKEETGHPCVIKVSGAGQKIFSFTTTATTEYIKWYDSISTDLNEKVQIAEGAEDKPYLPYGAIGIKRRGKNLWDEQWEVGAIDSTGQNRTSTNTIRSKGYINVAKVPIIFLASLQALYICYYDENKKFIRQNGLGGNTYTQKLNNAKYIRFYTLPAYGTTYKNDIAILSGMEGRYEPYTERIDNIDLKGHEVLSKDKIVVDKKGNVDLIKNVGKIVINLQSRIVLPNGNVGGYFNDLVDLKSKNNLNTFSFCNVAIFNSSKAEGTYYENFNNFVFVGNSEDTLETLKEKYDGGYLYYLLKDSQIIHLGQIEPIESLEGYNYVEVLATLEPTSMTETYVNDLSKEIEDLKNTIVSASL